MADQIDLVKDVTIAFLSTSGLLLTLIVALIVPRVSLGELSIYLRAAAFFLTVASILATFVLYLLALSPNQLQRDVRVAFFVGQAMFLIALALLGITIISL